MLLASALVLLAWVHHINAAQVYLSPGTDSLPSPLTPSHASFVLSRHFGLEHFEQLELDSAVYGEEPFIGKGLKNGILLVIREEDAPAVLPSSLQPSFQISLPQSTEDFSSLISTFVHRARHSFTSVYSSFDQTLISGTEAETVQDIVHSLQNFRYHAEEQSFSGVDLSSLALLRREGDSQYATASRTVRDLISEAFADPTTIDIAILVYSPSKYAKRELEPRQSQSPLPPHHPPPQEPIGSVSTCFSSLDACTNGTSSCSGRGKCAQASKAGRTCFVCSCGVTKTGEGAKTKTQVWVGESCERKDVSGSFVLLTGTVVGIVLLIAGSIGLLYGVGSQELPSTLLGGAVNVKRD